MNAEKLKVCWLSAGVSSFIAGYLARHTVDQFIYIDVEDQHRDSLRFIRDCEAVLGKRVDVLQPEYRNVENVVCQFHFIKSAYGAKCTEVLKKRVRKEWEYAHQNFDITYVWGMDCNERGRAERICDTMPQFHHEFPLIDSGLTKEDILVIPTTTASGASRVAWDTGTKSAWIFRRCLPQEQNWSGKLGTAA